MLKLTAVLLSAAFALSLPGTASAQSYPGYPNYGYANYGYSNYGYAQAAYYGTGYYGCQRVWNGWAWVSGCY